MKWIASLLILNFISGFILGQDLQQKPLMDSMPYSIAGYVPHRSVDRMTENSFNYITQAIYFGMDADGKGNLLIETAEKDLLKLDSLRGNRKVGISVCFGGWERSDFFVEMTAKKGKRKNFCEQVLTLCRDYKLNGVDIDWEYPKTKKERKQFEKLMKELHKTLSPHGLKITIAVGHWEQKARLSARVEPYLSAIHIMLYDNVDTINGHASFALVKTACERFIAHGIPPEKIVAGVPFYGRHRVNRNQTMAYREVPEPQKNISDEGLYDGYFFNPVVMMKQKVSYVKEMGLGGIMIWELGHDVDVEQDDSLLRAIWEQFTLNLN